MFKKMLASLISAAVLALSSSMLPTDALNTQPQEMTESEALAQVCAELGITDFDAYVAELAARMQSGADGDSTRDTCPFDPAYYIDIYTGGSSNGRIDAMDANYLLQFLTGQVNYPYVYNDLDPTHDYIIDRSDVQALLDCFSMVWIMEVYPDFVPGTHGVTNTTYPASSRTYERYSAQTGSLLGTYMLTPPTISATSMNLNVPNSNLPDRGIIGTDDRYLDYSKNGVAKLLYDSNNDGVMDGYVGTGFVVDDHVVATAAHVIKSTNGKKIKKIRLFNSNGTIAAEATAVEYHVSSAYSIYNASYSVYDYALITVSEDLSTYCCFDCGMILNNGLLNNTTQISVTGFPTQADTDGDGVLETVNTLTQNNEYTAIGFATNYFSGTNDAIVNFSHTADTSGNDSGSPIYHSSTFGSQSFSTVLGVHNGSIHYNYVYMNQNYGARMKPELFRFYFNNPNLNWTLS